MKTHKKKCRKVIGEIAPQNLYTSEGVMRAAGIGRAKIVESRQAKKIKPVVFGGRHYYKGADIIALITGEAAQQAVS